MAINQDWSIRKGTLADLEPLAKIFERYRMWYHQKPDFEGALEFLSKRLRQKESVIFVAQLNDAIVGFTQLYPLFSSTRMKDLWLLNDLYVEEKHRGKGISLGLIDTAKKLVHETGAFAMFLETDRTNDVGNQLYPRAGFVLNERSNYYEWVAADH